VARGVFPVLAATGLPAFGKIFAILEAADWDFEALVAPAWDDAAGLDLALAEALLGVEDLGAATFVARVAEVLGVALEGVRDGVTDFFFSVADAMAFFVVAAGFALAATGFAAVLTFLTAAVLFALAIVPSHSVS
jgi:hypothetical protein